MPYKQPYDMLYHLMQ